MMTAKEAISLTLAAQDTSIEEANKRANVYLDKAFIRIKDAASNGHRSCEVASFNGVLAEFDKVVFSRFNDLMKEKGFTTKVYNGRVMTIEASW